MDFWTIITTFFIVGIVLFISGILIATDIIEINILELPSANAGGIFVVIGLILIISAGTEYLKMC